METSVFVAQILGLCYVVFGFGMLMNGAYYKKAFDELLKNSGFMIFGGIFALIAGFLIINFHNVWSKDWTVLVTIVGWLALVKGLLIFVAPKALISFSKGALKNMKLVGFGMLIIGGVFTYFGFFA